MGVIRPSNPEIEKYYFEKFSAAFELPKGVIHYGDRPDVLIHGQKKFGVEITNFYVDSSGAEQSQISMRLNAIKRAQESFQKNTGKNIEYTFGFNRDHPIQRVGSMAKSIELLAKRFEDFERGQVKKENFEDIAEISFVWRGGEYEDCEWRSSQTFSTPLMNKDRLTQIIQEKAKKAKNYTVCDELWLLIVIEFMDLAQDQEIMNVQLDEIQSDIFNKVIIYKTGVEQIREVPMKQID